MNKQIILSSIAVLGLMASSCQTTQGSQNPKTVSGGAIGAVAGAILGNQTKGNKKSRRNARVAGALLGGLIGGSIGNYMDKQEQELRENLQASGVSVERQEDQIVLNLPSQITFASGKSTLSSRFLGVLDSVAKVLQKYDQTSIQVAGHTDSQGAVRDNQVLSEQRASSVASYMQRQGVSSDRLLTVGYGESDPITSNASASGRASNRRVEVTLVPVAH